MVKDKWHLKKVNSEPNGRSERKYLKHFVTWPEESSTAFKLDTQHIMQRFHAKDSRPAEAATAGQNKHINSNAHKHNVAECTHGKDNAHLVTAITASHGVT